jgi:beta-lactam-binding protein with PASTA domain
MNGYHLFVKRWTESGLLPTYKKRSSFEQIPLLLVLPMTIKQLLVLFSPFCFCVSGYVGMWYYCAPHQLRIPHLVGCSLENAAAIASTESLSLQVTEFRESDQYEIATVLFQSPAPGAQGKQGQTIYLTASKKMKSASAPQFVGRTRNEIEEIAADLHLYLDTHLVNGGAREGYCCAQWPEEAAPITNNIVVIYCVKPTESLVIMPRLQGSNLADLLLFLSERSIEWRLFGVEDQKIDHAKYRVTDQRPVAGSILSYKKGLVVDLQVEKVELISS